LLPIDDATARRLLRQARGERWALSADRFADALRASAGRAFADRTPTPSELERYLASLHLEDLALACACADGHEGAWEHFVRELRPALYRAADAIEPGGGARDLADSMYADLFGLVERNGQRRSLFRYFHGRSSLATWLRAILAQRHVDRLRSHRRDEPLPDDESPAALAAPAREFDPERERSAAALRQALARAIALLPPRDRLRLACYHAEELTLAETGKLLGEHESTVSRQLARTRKTLRMDVERALRDGAGLSDAEIAHRVAELGDDAGALDLRDLLGDVPGRKKSSPARSNQERSS
jgi:RNA polymerase sigma-70 factor (ECF subfamily)